jgi:hypothetical protein
MKRRKPAAFMGYVRFDDQHDDGQLTRFRERLSAEVQAQTGEEFPDLSGPKRHRLGAELASKDRGVPGHSHAVDPDHHPKFLP